MGYDIDRVIGHFKELLKCPICLQVVQDVVQTACCQQYFCRECLTNCIRGVDGSGAGICPFDRSRITLRKVHKVPRIVNEMLGSLTIQCQYSDNGCSTTCSLERIQDHEKSCDYRNEVLVMCECGLNVKREDQKRHNCVVELKKLVESCNKRVSSLEDRLEKLESLRNGSKRGKSDQRVTRPKTRLPKTRLAKTEASALKRRRPNP